MNTPAYLQGPRATLKKDTRHIYFDTGKGMVVRLQTGEKGMNDEIVIQHLK